jgi:dihydroorotase
MQTILIKNARIVNEGRVQAGDVLVRKGRIERIGRDVSAPGADLLIDARQMALLPGMIDDQVHFREPGLTHKGDMHSESAAAVAGGITSFMDMPNCQPQTTSREQLQLKHHLARGRSFANYAFYLGASNDNLEEIKACDPSSTCGIKVFMGASTGRMLVDDPLALEQLFRSAPVLIAAHCEDTPMIRANEHKFTQIYGENIPMVCHPLIRSRKACYHSSALAVELAQKHGSRLHVLHVSTKEELGLFIAAPLADKRITAEVCVHHLFFDDADYERLGTLIKCNPAIKTRKDRKALVEAVCNHRIDVIATDHAPHTLAEKQTAYLKAPSGLPLVQHALICLLEHVHAGRMTLPLIAAKTAHAPASLFQIKERGFIREGYWADLVLVDLNRPFEVDHQPLLSKCGWSPFSGRHFHSHIDTTIVSGQVAYCQGKLSPGVHGLALEFER